MANRRAGPSKFWFTYQGPFFRRDPAQTVADNLTAFLLEVGQYAESTAKTAAPFRSGQLREHLNLRTHPVSGGRRWKATVVISTWGLGENAWPGTRSPARGINGGPKRPSWFNYAGKVEVRYHFMKKGRKALLDTRRASRHLLKGLN